MLRMMTGLQIFLTAIFLLGVEVRSNPMDHCVRSMKFGEEFDSIIEMGSEQQLTFFCSNMSSFLRCVNEEMKDETGFNLEELADLLKGTEEGKAMRLLVNVQELVVDICTEGTELHNDYLASAHCYYNMDKSLAKKCDEQAKDAYSTFQELNQNAISRSEELPVESCVFAAYTLGCFGAAVHEECGETGFETYKKVVQKIGFFKSDICSLEIMQRIKGDFLDNLTMDEKHRDLYRAILILKRRRK